MKLVLVALLALALIGVVLYHASFGASDFMYGGVNCGQTSKELSLVFRLTADNTEATGILASQVTANYWRQGGSRVSISTTTLANSAVAYASGGFVEVDGTNMKGLYRFDPPDAAFACGVDWVTLNVVRVYGSATYVYYERFGLASAPDVNVAKWGGFQVQATPVTANVTQWAGFNILATVASVNVVNWGNVPVLATLMAANVSAWNGTAPNNLISGRVDSNTQSTAAGLTYNLTGNISGSVGSVTNRVTANTDQWNGTAVIATAASVNVVNWNSAFPNNLVNGRVPVGANLQTSVALSKYPFLLTDSTTHAPKPSVGAPGCTRSIDGGAFATGTLANVTEVASGIYTVDFGSGDLAGKNITLQCQGNSTDTTFTSITTVP